MDLSDEIMLGGMEDWLKSFPRQLLENWCTDFGLEFSPDSHEALLVEKIMEKMFQLKPIITELPVPSGNEEQDKEEPEPKIGNNSEKEERRGIKRKKENIVEDETEENSGQSKKKPRGKYKCPPLANIKRGVSRDDLHNLYNVTDLQKWCKENSIYHMGKKSVLIKRIITFLDTGDKPVTPSKKKEKEKELRLKKHEIASKIAGFKKKIFRWIFPFKADSCKRNS